MRNRRTGFTLVELLVVISIIAMLASLLMPAVNRAREAARRTQCMNNMRNIALAMMQYDTAKQRLPGWANNLCPDPTHQVATGTRSTQGAASWCFELLPYIEKGDLYYLYGPNNKDTSTSTSRRCMQNGVPQEHIKLLICPNDSGAVGSPNALSYVVNCGMRDRGWNSLSIGGGSDYGAYHSWNYLEAPGNGVFHNNWQYGNVRNGRLTGTRNRTLNSLAYISAGDGTASTLMVSENVDAGFWHGAHYQTPNPSRNYEGVLCFCWAGADLTGQNTNNEMRINVKIGQGRNLYAPRASGNHDSGVNVIFCDAHSAFISENIDWMTWCLLFTPNGRQVMEPRSNGTFRENQSLDPFRYTPLNEKY